MGKQRRGEADPDSGSAGKGGRVTVTVDFDLEANPELYAVVTAVALGKQRAQRVRSLMLKGHVFEVMHGLPGRVVSQTATRLSSPQSGADEVFGAPLDG